jgi:cytidine deaminase
MKNQQIPFSFEVFDSIDELSEKDRTLLAEARKATVQAYAPYSRFHVAAVARLSSGKILTGTNQENASFPAGICAERVLLSSISSVSFPDFAETIAISYDNKNGRSDHPISPCGICRQTLAEYEQRMNQPIRLVLGGLEGKVYLIGSASSLLPLAFTNDVLK